jgi:hypothetical protein
VLTALEKTLNALSTKLADLCGLGERPCGNDACNRDDRNDITSFIAKIFISLKLSQ